jgi:hypothetical protein
MVEIITWAFAGAFAASAIVVVYLIMQYIRPMAASPGKYFVKAKREKKPIFILDDGPIYRIVIGTDKQSKNTEILRAGEEKDVIKKGPGSLKYCEGVLMGIGENFRSFLANIAILDLMEIINEKEWTFDDIKLRLDKLVDVLKQDMGLTDEFKELRLKYEKEIEAIDMTFNEKRHRLLKKYAVMEDEKKGGADDEEPAA